MRSRKEILAVIRFLGEKCAAEGKFGLGLEQQTPEVQSAFTIREALRWALGGESAVSDFIDAVKASAPNDD